MAQEHMTVLIIRDQFNILSVN